MIDHLSIGTRDIVRAIDFYRSAFAPLGFSLQHTTDAEASFGPGSDRTFWLYVADAPAPMQGMHVAFAAGSREAVDAACDAARAHGGSVVREPGPRPDISDDYYGTIVLDPDGNRVEILSSVMV